MSKLYRHQAHEADASITSINVHSVHGMPKYKHTHYTLEATLTYGAMCVDMVTALELPQAVC